MSRRNDHRTVFSAAFLACATLAALPADAKTVEARIAVVGPLTGQLANLGQDVKYGGQLAIDALNAKHLQINGDEVHFDMVSADDGADPRTGTLVAQQLVDQHVTAVVGHINSGVAIPASKYYSDAGIPFISSGASNPQLTAQHQIGTFRDVADDNAQAQGMVDFLAKNLKVKSIGLVDDRTAYGQGLSDQVARDAAAAGIKVTREYTNDHAVDFRSILTTLKAARPDAVVLASTDAVASPFVKQMKSLGMNKVPFLGGDGICTANWVRVAGEAAEGQYCTQTGAALEKSPVSNAYFAAYQARYKQTPEYFGPYTYDAVMLVGTAIAEAQSVAPAQIIAALHKIRYTGLTGTIVFDANGNHKNAAVSVYQVKQQKITVLGVIGKM